MALPEVHLTGDVLLAFATLVVAGVGYAGFRFGLQTYSKSKALELRVNHLIEAFAQLSYGWSLDRSGYELSDVQKESIERSFATMQCLGSQTLFDA